MRKGGEKMQIQVRGSKTECEMVSGHYCQMFESGDIDYVKVGGVHFVNENGMSMYEVKVDLVYKDCDGCEE